MLEAVLLLYLEHMNITEKLLT